MKRFVLVGHPVAHSVSPAMHRAAYAALGVEATYEALDCPDEAALERVAERVRSGELDGANVTVPHKQLALALADRVDPLAEETGAANVWAREGDRIAAHNTDVDALADRIRRLAPGARRAQILGGGGAALAAVAACRRAGVRQVVLTARKIASKIKELGVELREWPETDARADLIVQATSAGMRGADPGELVRDAVDWQRVPAGAVAIDLVYNPRVTPFLAAARARGIACEGGLPMLVGQAALAIEIWLGVAPPTDAMEHEAVRALEAA